MIETLYVAFRGGTENNGQWGVVGRLDHVPATEYSKAVYRYRYTRGAETLLGFRPFPGMDRIDEIYESREMLPLFTNRLLPKSRPEYAESLAWSGFDPNHPPGPMAILAVTEGLRATDSIEVFPRPQQDANGQCVHSFFIHGIRHLRPDNFSRVGQLQVGEELNFVPEDSNPRDPQAVAVHTNDDVFIGYLPRYLARDVRFLLRECPDCWSLTVKRLNQQAPLQQKVLCQMVACWPESFQPCGGPEFQPLMDLPADVAAV